MNSLKSGLPAKSKQELDSFVSGAEKKTTVKKAQQNQKKENYSWEDLSIRKDVMKAFNLRVSEPYFYKLKYIAETSPDSMQKICLKAIEKEIDKRIKLILKGKE